MFKKICTVIGVALVGVWVAGCDPQAIQPALQQYHVVLAPESMYNCPVVKKWPNIKTLSDLQTARLIVQLAENNNICKASVDALHKFYNEAAARFETKVMKR